ncbi:MAG: hypothetical protein A4E57_03411 [Syntrophorhabdaceae bacterium PtaU1.Bin034]|nr:MAG: hypothetical protein A4E57_03411 [Syntrophorhabdaceae bacterium PtaU1.Bin034]
MLFRRGEEFLTRSGLRDLVILLSAVSAFFFKVTNAEIVTAFLVLFVGSFIHFIAKGVLIRNEVLCKEGIYSLIRHPYYFANYLVDSSFCLMSGNYYLFLLYPFLFFSSYGPTMRKEERTLVSIHPEAVDHILSTPQVFPDSRSIFNVKHLFSGFSLTRITGKEVARILRFFAMGILILAVHRIPWNSIGRITEITTGPWIRISVLSLFLAGAVLYGANLLILKFTNNR